MGITGRWLRLFAESINDPQVIFLSDRAFRLWINLKCCDVVYDGCFPSDSELAWYCRLKPKQFSVRIEELLKAKFVERGPDGNLALVPRRYENYRLNAIEWAELRLQVFERDNYTCTYCGGSQGPLECDHIFPLSRGGTHDFENLTTACKPCNRAKAAKTVEEWRQ